MFWEKSKLSLTPLGDGVNYVGHNCFLVSEGSSAVVLDCGIKPQTQEGGKELGEAWRDPPARLDVLDKVKRNTIGFITHAHLDHIGAIRELICRDIPVYLSPESRIFLARYSENLKIPKGAEIYTFNSNQIIRNGNLEISFIPVQHSIPGTHAILVRSGSKSILYLVDFKLNGMRETLQESRNIFRGIKSRVGRINCLIIDILNAEIEGFTPPEQLVIDSINDIVRKTKGRVFITFFSSNIRRMAGILNIARAHRRTVGVFGRSMRDSYTQLTGYRRPYKYGDIILLSGSQGEQNSGLSVLANGGHRFLSLSSKDRVVLSSRGISGNEGEIKNFLEDLHEQGVRIVLHHGESKKLNLSFDAEEAITHFSGHGYRGDQLEAVGILEPEIIVPFHAPPDRYEIFEKFIGGKRIKRLQVGETLKI